MIFEKYLTDRELQSTDLLCSQQWPLRLAAPGVKTLHVCDALGRERLNVQLINNSYRIYRNQLPAGVYFFTITKDDQFINTGKFVIR